MTEQKNKVFYLDGIRGLAAFCVFIHHFMLAFYPAYYKQDLSATHLNGWELMYGNSVFSFLTNGHFCVSIFFVLSGFVLSRSYFAREQFETLVSAAQRRFLRLYIPVAVTLALAYVLIKANLYYNVQASAIAHSEWWLGNMWQFEHKSTLFLESLLYKTMFLGDNTYDTSLWTLSLELYGSMFVFAFLALTHNIRNKAIYLITVLAVLVLLDSEYYTAFLLGISLNYFNLLRGKMSRHVAFITGITLLMAGLVIGSYPSTNIVKGTLFEHLPEAVMQHGKWIHIVGGFFVVLGVVLSKSLQRFFSLRPFRFLGYISFSIYLIHPLIIGSFSSFVLIKLAPYWSYNSAMVMVTLGTVSVSLSLSYLMAKYIDAKGTAIARNVYEKYMKRG